MVFVYMSLEVLTINQLIEGVSSHKSCESKPQSLPVLLSHRFSI